MDREIYIRQGIEIAEATGFHKSGLIFRGEAGLILKCAGSAGNNGLRISKEYNFSLDTLKGCFLRTGSTSHKELFRITDADDKESILYIEGNPARILTEHVISVNSGESLPIMAARLLSETPLNQDLPSCDIRVVIERDPPEDAKYPFMLLISRKQSGLCHGSSVEHLHVGALIDKKGEILESLEENEINRVLRKVYQNPGAVIFIMFENSELNPVHEKIFLNLLRTAGYRKSYASHMPDSILPVLPHLTKEFAESCLSSRLEKYSKEICEKLGEGSSFRLIL